MITAFLITSLVVFCVSLILNLIVLGFNLEKGSSLMTSVIGIVIYLLLITFNIFALVSL